MFFHQNFPPLFFTIIFTFHINLKINSRSLLCIVFSTFTKLVLKASLIWWSDLHRNITQAASQRTPYHHPLTSPLPSAAAMCTCVYFPPLSVPTTSCKSLSVCTQVSCVRRVWPPHKVQIENFVKLMFLWQISERNILSIFTSPILGKNSKSIMILFLICISCVSVY